MAIAPLHDPGSGPLKAIGFMSGEGTNVEKLLRLERNEAEWEKFLGKKAPCPFQIAAVFSDSPESNAEKIGKRYGLPTVVRDLRAYCRKIGKPISDLAVRRSFDEETLRELRRTCDARFAVYGGYLKLVTAPLLDAYVGVNVHPGDLSILGPGGKRKYAVHHPVDFAIRNGEEVLRSTTCLIGETLQDAKPLLISKPLHVLPLDAFHIEDPKALREVADYHMKSLKGIGDWDILPATLAALGAGIIRRDETGAVYFFDMPIPNGLRINRFQLKDHL